MSDRDLWLAGIRLFVVLLAVILLLWPVAAQPFCNGPYCGPVDPQYRSLDPYGPPGSRSGYGRGPVGDWIDRCFNCQGPQFSAPPGMLYDRNGNAYLPPPLPPFPVQRRRRY